MTTTDASPAATRLTELMFEFLGYLELERGLSRNTLEAYRSDLEQYGAYLRGHGFDPLEITPPELAGFITSLAAPSTAATLGVLSSHSHCWRVHFYVRAHFS